MLRIVHLEDSANDRTLVAETLRAELSDCTIVEVETREAFERALADGADVILSDYSLPSFTGDAAQALANARCPDVPFVFVSGSIGEEAAVARLKEGATDYVLKDRLDKLVPAVRRALRETEDRRRRTEAEGALRRLNAELEGRVEERTRALTVANEELERARQEADRANHSKSEFLSRMSHDLRTPLNAIMGFAQLLQLDNLSADQQESVGHILHGGRHLLNLIDEVLDIARIESGHLSLSPEPVAMADVVEHAVALVRPQAQIREITIVVGIDSGLCVFADRQRLRQILLNLLSNAVKYNYHGGSIFVRASALDGAVRVEVADTGPGIPAGKLALLFIPFERLGAEQTGIEGTGLGLVLSKHLAEQMQGTLTAAEAAEGARFHLTLPATAAPPAEPHVAAPPAVATGDYGGTILYIEDNLSNVRLMERVVRTRPNVALTHAPDGATGLEMIRADRPDLVILDLHLADMPGEEVLRHLWTSRLGHIPVAVLSADATPPTRRRLLASGAIAYLTKPLDIAELMQLIDRVVGKAAGRA